MSRITLPAAGCLLATIVAGQVFAQVPVPDPRYPVTVTPSEALAQKEKMRTSLVALRMMLVALSEKDFSAVERAVPDLGHGDFRQKAATTVVYEEMDREFREATKKVVAAAREKNTDAVLRELGATMAWCQSCHAGLRQEVIPAEPDNLPVEK